MNHETSLEQSEPLIAIPEERNGRIVTRYFFSEEEADRVLASEGQDRGVGLAGAWSDLDWDQAVEELEQIRHGNEPTPPITDLRGDTCWTPASSLDTSTVAEVQ